MRTCRRGSIAWAWGGRGGETRGGGHFSSGPDSRGSKRWITPQGRSGNEYGEIREGGGGREEEFVDWQGDTDGR